MVAVASQTVSISGCIHVQQLRAWGSEFLRNSLPCGGNLVFCKFELLRNWCLHSDIFGAGDMVQLGCYGTCDHVR